MDPQTKTMVDALAAQEGRLCQLYHRYSLVFPDREFWVDISKDESVHEQWVLSLANSPEITFVQGRFDLASLQTMTAYINKQIEESSKVSLIQALSISLDLEKSLI